MGFDVFGPTRHVKVSNVDDGSEFEYDIFRLPSVIDVPCPLLAHLDRRFYETTILCFADGNVQALRDELSQLSEAYRRQAEPKLIAERGIRARDPKVRESILYLVLQDDPIYQVLQEFLLLCDEAISSNADVRCVGD